MVRHAVVPLLFVIATGVAQWATCTQAVVPPVLDEVAPAETVPAVASAPGSIEELEKRVAVILEREGVPGAGIALVNRDGPIWIGGVGVADLTTGVPVDGDTVFRIASITKSFIGLGVMRLVEQGRLDLDRPLRELMPEIAIDNAWDDESPVTLAQVLEHTAGLDDMRFNEVFADDDRVTTGDALAINPRSRVIRWRPGTRMSYSNVGYTLAGRAIEKATGEPFDVWLRREIIRPLGMPDADFERTEVLASRLATGHIGRGRPTRFRPIFHRPAGAMLASATDLAKYVHYWLHRGATVDLVSPAGLARIERSATMPWGHVDAEYGLGNYGDPAHPAFSHGHDGGLPGFASCLRYFPSLGVGYVLLLDATHSARAYFEIRALLYAYLTRRLTVTAPVVPAIAEKPDAGFYLFKSPRNQLLAFVDQTIHGFRVESGEGGVHVEPLVGPSFDLVPTADGAYRHPLHSGSIVRFAHARDGTPVLTGMIYAEASPYWPARVKLVAITIALLLLQLAPWWAAATFVIAALRRRRLVAPELVVWPAVAGLVFFAIPKLFFEAARAQVLGEAHVLTVLLFAATIGFALAAGASVFAALRWSFRRDRPALWRRLVPLAMSVSAFGLAVWLAANGIIGLRTWLW